MTTQENSRMTRCLVCHQIRLHVLTSDQFECAACGSAIPSDALLAAKDRELRERRSRHGLCEADHAVLAWGERRLAERRERISDFPDREYPFSERYTGAFSLPPIATPPTSPLDSKSIRLEPDRTV